MQKKRKRNSTALTSENGFIGRPFTNCFLHHYLVDQQQCETTALMAVVHIGAENETRTRDPHLGKVMLYH